MSKRKDSAYVSGVIAVKEKKLLKDKLAKMCSMSGEEALRLLLDSGFGGDPSLDIEDLILADEREIDAFIREYAPTDEVEEYLLSPRDFHNAKAIVKARYLNTDPKPMLGGDGKFDHEEIARLIEAGNTEKLGKELSAAIKEAQTILEGENPSGAEVGFLFDKAQFAYLSRVLKKFGVCRKLLVRRVDMTNLLTYFRAENAEEAEKFFVDGGSLTKEKLASVYGGEDAALKAFEKTDYNPFVKKLVASSGGGFMEAERMLESFETDFFAEKPYELSGQGTFLYYIFRRRVENENVRVVFVCLRAGLNEAEIKKRLRGKI
ncbi:MAG: V-type ATPase subunit [Clostridia bacterium]|nr:V-type ATPase subunit [Clostridia bacterium]